MSKAVTPSRQTTSNLERATLFMGATAIVALYCASGYASYLLGLAIRL